MSSALEARPKLRDDVKIVRREVHGKIHYVVREPDEQKYFQFGETEVGLMRLLDGRRTPDHIADAADRELGIRPAAGSIADFAHKLKRMGLVERTHSEQRLMLMERLRGERKVRARRRTKGSILRLRFSLGDPDKLFDRTVARFKWIWSRPFVHVTLILFAIYFAVLIVRWGPFWETTVNLYTLSGIGPWDIVLLYAIGLTIGVFHEFGHGLTTKAFGGEVHEIGGMMLYFSPALFCNTNDAWTFNRRSHRLWVTFAGPWVDMLFASVAAIFWVLTEPGTFINTLAFYTFLSGGVLSLLANLNPLLPLDGYYALSDYLEITNLRRRSFEYWGWLGKRVFLGMDLPEPAVTPRERTTFILYGGLAIAYSVFMIVVGLVWLILVIGRLIGPIVWLLVGFSLVGLLRKLSGRGQALAQAAATTWRSGFMRGPRAGFLIATIVALLVLPFILPWTIRARGELVIEGAPRAYVRAQVDGILDRWNVREGETIQAGQPIAVLWNADVESAFIEIESRAERLRLDRARAEARGDLAGAASASSVLREVEQQLAVLREQRERLIVRSPIAGTILGHRLHEQRGMHVREGDLLIEVAGSEGRRARVRVPLKRAGAMASGQRASLKLYARPDLKFVSTVSGVAPAAEAGWLEADVLVPTDGWLPAPGMTGIAKIATRRVTIAQAIARAVRQTLRIDLLL